MYVLNILTVLQFTQHAESEFHFFHYVALSLDTMPI